MENILSLRPLVLSPYLSLLLSLIPTHCDIFDLASKPLLSPDLGWSDREEVLSMVALGLALFWQMGQGMPMYSLYVSWIFFTLWLIWKIVGDV